MLGDSVSTPEGYNPPECSVFYDVERKAEARRDLSVSYNNLGNICEAKGDPDAAEKYHEMAEQVLSDD